MGRSGDMRDDLARKNIAPVNVPTTNGSQGPKPQGRSQVRLNQQQRRDVLELSWRMAQSIGRAVTKQALWLWKSPNGLRLRAFVSDARRMPYSGTVALLGGVALLTALIAAIDVVVLLPNPAILYLPLIAFIAYYWSWRHGALTVVLALVCIYFVLIPPAFSVKPLHTEEIIRVLSDLAVSIFILALAQLAVSRRVAAEREAQRFASLTSVGMALAGELEEASLLRLIAQTACDITGAGFAAFTLRPVDKQGHPVVPSQGNLFHLAAVVGVTPDQEAMFRRVPLGGEGFLAPIFRYGKPVLVGDVLSARYIQDGASPANPSAHPSANQAITHAASISGKEKLVAARAAARSYASGEASVRDLRSVGMPRGHPVVRSFLGVPLLNRNGEVRGGLLLGHIEANRFSLEDQRLLTGLASQAATALENARLFHSVQTQAEELDTIFESIVDGVALLDANGNVARENRIARELRESHLASEQDGEVKPLSDLLKRVQSQEAGSGEQTSEYSAPLILKTTTGERREYLLNTAQVKPTHTREDVASVHIPAASGAGEPESANASGTVVVWHDVTAARQLITERQARAEADERRALLQTIVDALPSGVYLVHGHEARLLLANQAALDAWGAQWEPGQPMVDFLQQRHIQVLRPDGQEQSEADLATLRSVRTGQAVRHYQEIIRQPNGKLLPVLFNAVVVNSSLLKGSLPGDSGPDVSSDEYSAIVVLQDVTPLKEAERLKDEFIAVAAHELKTPMAAVKGYAGMLARGEANGMGTSLEDWQVEAVDAIDTATTRLVELTNDLLDVARLQAGRIELRQEPHDLIALTRRVVRRFQVTTEKHNITVESEDEYVIADVDAPRIEQVLGNLVSNAIKYSPDGGDITISVMRHSSSEHARIIVRDPGIGIPEEQQARLFAKFARADNARDRGISGTGLGLYLCKELLAQHGGRIWFESHENAGSTVYVELPTRARCEEDISEDSIDEEP